MDPGPGGGTTASTHAQAPCARAPRGGSRIARRVRAHAARSALLSALLSALVAVLAAAVALPAHAADEQERWRQAARDSTITRDDWGIAHVWGKTDADAVFAMITAQAEDDFARVETNYLNALGRLAEAEGESALFQDLRMRLFVDPDDLGRRYRASPAWLQALMVAWADGLNAFLYSHPQVHPRVIRHYEPWMALSFSEGSIGGDIERVALGPLQAFYGGARPPVPADPPPAARLEAPEEPRGSNGIAIAPANTAGHHALLLINPHTSFFFRSELQVRSDEGLDVYGAATWGQFFIYQGFNAHLGWMHTSSGIDNVDFFLETIVRRGDRLFYRYGKQLRPVQVARMRVACRGADGRLRDRFFTVYRTHHGPVVRRDGDRWVSIALMQKPVEALSQSFLRTKAQDYAAFLGVLGLLANSSNNTIYADDRGNIAYLHPQFVPRRDDRFDYTHPVDGADPATDWGPLHDLDELPHVLNPPGGWIANTNNWPYSAAGADSPRREDFPRYMDTAGENPRGVHAAMLLRERRDFTPASLQRAAFDPYLPAFARLVPLLVSDYDALQAGADRRAELAEAMAVLRGWDYRWSADSVATTLAVLWGDELWSEAQEDATDGRIGVYDAIAQDVGAPRRLAALSAVMQRLRADFGDWRVPWGRMNRFQRVSGAIEEHFTDDAPSIPIAFTSGRWGSLASFGAKRYPGTSRYYGTSGNSFVAIVEFGARVSARAVSIGGESGDPGSAHFNDQSQRYADGDLRPVYFHDDELAGHIDRVYHPAVVRP
jgi:acyl-homoserine-lactone acylase